MLQRFNSLIIFELNLFFAHLLELHNFSFLQSPWGVAGGAIAGHLVATSVAVLGGAFLAKYISEKLVCQV